MKWTQENIERCKVLWKAGKHSSREIAVIISQEWDCEISHNAVICRMNRSGESFNGPNRNNVTHDRRAPRLRSALSADELERVRERERERDRRYKARRREQRGLPPVAQQARPRPAVPLPYQARRPAGVPAPVARPAVQQVTADVLPSLDVPLLDARHGQCRYICGDPRVLPTLYCGNPTAPDSPWCPGHRLVCVQAVRPRVFVPHQNRRVA
ncbi:hypothetical protein MKL09_29235 [Methylobacterium sp. J-048]|uniref:GcrA family cell cycle regulator n=1 Tax=Methylobacterium sp. J-048 TaxID=2836635 RepID=UPI001FBB28D5|nr:GcrA family cell cycle regulator [Methylobacterium sp. J-048]MCJ2060596.1 hypothetical protein [Methylobacterium sp. J-048]